MIPESFIADRPTSLRRRPGSGVIARYRDWLPVSDSDPVITLGEGGTPLVAAEKLSEIAATARHGSRSRAPIRPVRSRTAA